MDQLSDAMRGLQALRTELHTKLLENTEYRALVEIERAIENLNTGPSRATFTVPSAGPSRKRASQLEAAAEILNEHARPLSLDELVAKLKAKGIKFRGKRPEFSLSANLSSHKEFRSIKYVGKRCWWFANRAVPPEHGKNSAKSSANNSEAYMH